MTKPEPIVIVGVGGFGREVHDIVCALDEFELEGFLDDGTPDQDVLARRGAKLLGGTGLLASLGRRYAIGIASPAVRRRVDLEGLGARLEPVTLVHPSATRGLDVELGPGAIICAHTSITTNVRAGRCLHLNLNSTIGHDARLGDYVTINPGANISGGVVLEDDVTIGTGATVNQGLVIGSSTVVGAGAAVVTSLPPEVTAVGVPAKPR